MGKYLEDARKLYQHALQELRQWQEERDETLLRDASEKAWGAVSQAANELLDAHGRKVPSGTHARRDELNALERQNRQLRGLRFRTRFAAVENILYKECFYDGVCPLPLVTDVIEEVGEYLDDVEAATQQRH
ncbi:MAG: hypothetical protein L0177_01560 [Chloroflexi bacterium]|nr:hypothetical protein [Chloroflexota bacterium]